MNLALPILKNCSTAVCWRDSEIPQIMTGLRLEIFVKLILLKNIALLIIQYCIISRQVYFYIDL